MESLNRKMMSEKEFRDTLKKLMRIYDKVTGEFGAHEGHQVLSAWIRRLSKEKNKRKESI